MGSLNPEEFLHNLRRVAFEWTEPGSIRKASSLERLHAEFRHLGYALQEGDLDFHSSGQVERFGRDLVEILQFLETRVSTSIIDDVWRTITYSARESSHPGSRDLYSYLQSTRAIGLRGSQLRTDDVKAKKDEEKKAKEEEQNIVNILDSLSKISLTDSDRILFFIGAGASKPSPSNIPTVNELLPELWKRSSRLESKPLEKLQTWCKENNIENIEEMLTAVTISNFIIKNPKVHGLLNSVLYPEYKSMSKVSLREIDSIVHVENMLNTFFSLLVGTMLEAKPNAIHKSIAEYAKNHTNIDLLTTNYDACLDQALDEHDVLYNNILNPTENPKALKLIKMHGSINWFYCDSCQSVFSPAISVLNQSIKDRIPYSVSGRCSNCNMLVRQFIIPPVAHKYLTHPPIVQIWEEGRKALERARVFVIVGYSFADADDYIAKMMVKTIGQNPNKLIIVINRDELAIQKCKSFIASHVDNFNEQTQFVGLIGDALAIVPRVIKSLSAVTPVAQATDTKSNEKT